MNLSRRSLLTSLIAAPAVIAIDSLMPVRLFIPTIYGDAIHDDYEGLLAWLKGERVNILPRGFSHNDDVFNIGHGVFRTSKGIIANNQSLKGSPEGTTLVGEGEYTLSLSPGSSAEGLGITNTRIEKSTF